MSCCWENSHLQRAQIPCPTSLSILRFPVLTMNWKMTAIYLALLLQIVLLCKHHILGCYFISGFRATVLELVNRPWQVLAGWHAYLCQTHFTAFGQHHSFPFLTVYSSECFLNTEGASTTISGSLFHIPTTICMERFGLQISFNCFPSWHKLMSSSLHSLGLEKRLFTQSYFL